MLSSICSTPTLRFLTKQVLKLALSLLASSIEKSANISANEANLENLIKREKSIKNEIQNIILEIDKTKFLREDILKIFNEIDKKRNSILEKKEKNDKKIQEKNEKLNNFDNEINNLLLQYRIDESRVKFLKETEKEKEGFIKSVKSLLIECEKNNNLSKGVHGVLSNLIEVDKKYQVVCVHEGHRKEVDIYGYCSKKSSI